MVTTLVDVYQNHPTQHTNTTYTRTYYRLFIYPNGRITSTAESSYFHHNPRKIRRQLSRQTRPHLRAFLHHTNPTHNINRLITQPPSSPLPPTKPTKSSTTTTPNARKHHHRHPPPHRLRRLSPLLPLPNGLLYHHGVQRCECDSKLETGEEGEGC